MLHAFFLSDTPLLYTSSWAVFFTGVSLGKPDSTQLVRAAGVANHLPCEECPPSDVPEQLPLMIHFPLLLRF